MNYIEEFYKRLEDNYNALVQDWIKLDPLALIENAERIAAAKTVMDQIRNVYISPAALKYLLTFENPLEVIQEGYILQMDAISDYNPVDELSDTVHNLYECRVECDYSPVIGVTMC